MGFCGNVVAVYRADFTLLIESNGYFQNQEKVISCGTNAAHDIRDVIGVRQRLVNGLAELLDQPFEIVVKLQKSPFGL